jgi:hypothetical protein
MLPLRESQFCALIRAAEWRAWLGEHAPDLSNDLKAFLDGGHGCRANQEKMLAIREALYKRDLGIKFEQFVTHRYPMLVLRDDPPRPAQRMPRQNVAPALPIPLESRDARLNKHNIFKHYRPDQLSFPHKVIISHPDKQELQRRVNAFTKQMVGVHVLYIDDTAYIEYLLPKFKDVVAALPDSMYETKARRNPTLKR